ncbi:MAG: 23S rRNA (adenine(2503)-C(2))-methyltransferase RlmN [Candidatus Onthovivens sp.]|nr:23S rRNA (adenine(2503)-C(2))-methyltransferase RlmN [Mollicutes bacterium]MDY3778038.1 23S rRNA (adenine(2503)-C(2))-methyltransferase RlmN [Candidatus Onthovivens sp.]MDY4184117.1 23S rRNA (adenine(2503)-C(2))-methyltransferase RlmN [Candidatus Onthovivens sp.]MDY5667827.1 23S rRNA (adenine(2503)-C(2))-methyltransferase RlmN [Candidatus Onthovivens sp.]MDY6058654.1 23S rRNA (adenine(2503)-C(2))-methyltransferase RlmN [Candidatus Onthovivens sp.]
MKNLYGYKLEDLEELMISLGQKKYRATQIFKWIYERGVTNFDEMSDISLSFREVLKNEFTLSIPTIYKKQVSSDGTIKLLLSLGDDSKIETVLMRYNYGLVACVTSQVGCNMGCAFCASGLFKKQRNLEVHELVGQILVLNNLLKEENRKITHVVVMGTGEPFDNYDHVMKFIRILNNPHGFAIGARHLTVSTCGLVEKIREYANEGIQINLAISLHAPSDKIRNKIMPISLKYPLDQLMDAVKYYEATAKRRVTFEYILLEDINDSIENAKELAKLIKGTTSYVNLIPYNPVGELKYKRTSGNRVHRFMDALIKEGVNVTVRKEFGTDIDAACGQLRAKNG